MKIRLGIVLLLSTALVLPVFAQDSNSSAPPATSAETASGKPPLVQPKPQNWWDGDQPGLAWLVLHPYASKKYVKRQLQAVDDRVNELNQLTSSNDSMLKDVDSRAQHGIQLASAKVTEADQHSTDATSKAQMASQTATTVNSRATTVETVVGSLDQYKSANQTVIHFRSGQSALSKQAKDALDEMVSQLKDQHGYVIEVQGFSSGHGQAGIASSRKMADSVVRYLVLNHEIPAYRIYVMALGNASLASEDASAAKRGGSSRVEVSVLRNGVDELASSTSK